MPIFQCTLHYTTTYNQPSRSTTIIVLSIFSSYANEPSRTNTRTYRYIYFVYMYWKSTGLIYHKASVQLCIIFYINKMEKWLMGWIAVSIAWFSTKVLNTYTHKYIEMRVHVIFMKQNELSTIHIEICITFSFLFSWKIK